LGIGREGKGTKGGEAGMGGREKDTRGGKNRKRENRKREGEWEGISHHD